MRAYPRSGPVNTTVSLVTIPRDHATLEDLARSRNLSLRQQTRIILKQGNSESIVYSRDSYYQVSLSRIRISKVCNFTRRIRYLSKLSHNRLSAYYNRYIVSPIYILFRRRFSSFLFFISHVYQSSKSY